MDKITHILSDEFERREEHVEAVIKLLDEGCTVPFIARYRKEMHGAMDDALLRSLSERLAYLRNLDKRRDEVLSSIESQGKLTDELSDAVSFASTLAELEDIYRPYKQKRRTRASIAREKGLGPLADILLEQGRGTALPELLAEDFVDTEKGVASVEDALAGASDIIAETVSDSSDARRVVRELVIKRGYVSGKGASEEDSVYSMYYDFSQPVSKVQGHQILALNRGEAEEFLKVSIDIDEDLVLPAVVRLFVLPGSASSGFVRLAVEDGFKRLLWPSVQREIRSMLTDSAAEGAIHNFALNLRPLLMQPPVKGHVTMGFDPAYRTGCKLAVIDGTGRVLDTAVIYPTPPHSRTDEAAAVMLKLIRKYGIEHIAIGNGTASRESEAFVASLLHEAGGVSYAIVNEAGASVYSASELGTEEFPDFDVSLRSAVSIARRLQDPLAELVKIDPKSIGVGQYQHDMPQARLSETLVGVVEDCVNSVGADLNTASPSLLSYISGLNKTTAKNIVLYREEKGSFKRRRELLKVPKLGPKAFEQCAGFLRVPESDMVFDNTAVHPESYKAAELVLKLCGFTPDDVKNGNISDLRDRVSELGEEIVSEKCNVGLPTLRDIVSELLRPGRDPRDDLPSPVLRTDVMEMKDLKPGLVLTGTVRNVIDFGAFVDIGVHQDGLVHISQICDRYLKHPSEVLSVGDIVKVVVLDVDEKKKRIALSIRQADQKS